MSTTWKRLNALEEKFIMPKNLLSSKRFWSGVIATLTSLSLIFTGEKTLTDQLPFIVTTVLALIQTFIALRSVDVVAGFGKK